MKTNRAVIVALFILFTAAFSCTTKRDKANSLFGNGFGLNNVTIIVGDLDSARNYFADVLGFDVPKPERFETGMYAGTRSVSIWFVNLSSIELLAPVDSTPEANRSFVTDFIKRSEGVRLFSFATSSSDTTREWLTSRGFKTDSVHSGRSSIKPATGWSWDDGGPEWRTVELDHANPPPHLPRFIEYEGFPYKMVLNESKATFSYYRRYYNHPNGVVGLVAMRLVVNDIKAAREDLIRMGLTLLNETDSALTFHVMRNQQLEVITPQPNDEHLRNFLKTHGDGVHTLRFEVKNVNETHEYFKKTLPQEAIRFEPSSRVTVFREFARGVQLEFIQESQEQTHLARIYGFEDGKKLDTAALRHASALYEKYCSLCHGKDREGYAADFAPSLRSHSLMATAYSPKNPNYLKYVVSYGRPGTAMAGYAKTQGGPLEEADIELLLQWLYERSGVEKKIELTSDAVAGDASAGRELYAKHCIACHGAKGEGISAPALGNPMFLATASDAYLRYAISEGRDNTPMPSFKKTLTNTQIDALTAYLRSRASGWHAPDAIVASEPLPEHYILNPENASPKFTLREGRYVPAKQLADALKDSLRLVLLDARSKAAWHQSHIPGAIPVPYYDAPDSLIRYLPKDSTWIVAYCACPHAASERVVNTLHRYGYKNTAVLDEGILVWTQLGYPIQHGQERKIEEKSNKKVLQARK